MVNRNPLRIGLANNLTPGATIHATTFLRAIELGQQQLGEAAKFAFISANDEADPGAARRAAQTLLAEGVDLVLGHYASGAAAAAAPIYRRQGVPLILTATTADHLTDDHDNLFRLCGTDSTLAALIATDLVPPGRTARLWIGHDRSTHGTEFARCLRAEVAGSTRVRLVDHIAPAEILFFAGKLAASVDFVSTMRGRSCRQLIALADDAAVADLPARLPAGEIGVIVYGFAPPHWIEGAASICRSYHESWGEDPGVYFIETYAAMQI
ncbi:MAG: ABC transporter substrate-binding protein, partial [Geminicoccaceae bacterium]